MPTEDFHERKLNRHRIDRLSRFEEDLGLLLLCRQFRHVSLMRLLDEAVGDFEEVRQTSQCRPSKLLVRTILLFHKSELIFEAIHSFSLSIITF